MSLSKPTSSSTTSGRPTLPQAYGYLTIVQSGTAIVFSTVLVTHLSGIALANFGGIHLTNKAIILGRVFYQNRLLEPIVVFGAFWGHVLSGLAKRGIKLYWKYRKADVRKLYGEVYEKVEKIVEDETNEQGVVVRQKITTKTTTTITSSYLSRASALLLPFHILTGYLLFPLAATHFYVMRILPKRELGDSSSINATYATLAFRKFPKTSYLITTALICFGVYHVVSGIPAATRALLGAASKTKNGEKPPVALTEKEKRKQRNIRHGVIGVTTGVLLGGMYWIGGRFGRDQFRIPQRVQYLQLYGRVLPASWVRY